MAWVNYNGLKSVKTKALHFTGFDIWVQFNPKRIVSSAAKLDPRSIAARPCFLCSHNRPKQQQGISFKKNYTILMNPFPIFPRHLTIIDGKHTPQLIHGRFEDMLDLAATLEEFVIFYNGPECGASAPDHFHFQAGSKGFLPIEKDFHNHTLRTLLLVKDKVKVFLWDEYMRNALTFQSSNKSSMARLFTAFYGNFQQLQPNIDEPMMNILIYYEHNEWITHLFPRKLHRPRQYFEQGEKQLLLSPASVDMGGVLITPREKDFVKITPEDVADIFSQVCMDASTLDKLIDF